MKVDKLMQDFEEKKEDFYRDLLAKEKKDIEEARSKEREKKQDRSNEK